MVRVAIAILVSVLMGSTAHAKRVALVVGIDKYDNLPRERQLAKAVNDARAMEAALKAVGFDVIKAEDVGRSSFNQAWQQLLNKLAPSDEVAVFFSGHGVEIEGGNYLVPRDVPAVGTGEARRLKNESLSFDEMRRDLAAHGPKLSLFILDACRDNPFADTRGRSIGGAKGLVPVQAEYGTFIMFAAGARESALDRLGDTDSDPNSIYTRKLLPLLKQPGLRLPDVAQRVRGEVRQLAGTVGHRQSPAYYDEGADDVCLAGCAAPQALLSEAAEAWSVSKDTTSIAALEAFIARYKDTYYADLARLRIEALRKQEAAVASPPKAPTVPPGADHTKPAIASTPTPPRPGPPPSADHARPPIANTPARPATPPGTDPTKPALAFSQPPTRCDGVETIVGNERQCLKPKDSFKDCADCPEMVVVPVGEFMMGSPLDEEGRSSHEGPQRKVTIAKPFAVGKFEVTFVEWDACVGRDDCKHMPQDHLGRGKRPVTNVSWDDITKEYLPWLSRKTAKPYRLLTEAEWEYAARAGTTTPFSTGRTITSEQANFDGNHTYGGSAKGARQGRTINVGFFQPNAFGLYDMHGNAWEWVEDCYHDGYQGAPTDGAAWTSGDCSRRVLRGGSWGSYPRYLRAAFRGRDTIVYRGYDQGFRLARTLSP